MNIRRLTRSVTNVSEAPYKGEDYSYMRNTALERLSLCKPKQLINLDTEIETILTERSSIPQRFQMGNHVLHRARSRSSSRSLHLNSESRPGSLFIIDKC